ncbi:hypothetical protein LSTR_LSTR005788 [Laodelphax striatellus]|uniref:Guided entry of tail-anchored proteins factor 1 n=1 Tax=Laodelphax striatellus TaxID=195883 RepID=A0A482X1E2_LAOST|nr:hypothetical protein LSTR_LSTR005788 [Laodelphax striatellus]
MTHLIIYSIVLALVWEYMILFLKPILAVLCRENSSHRGLKQEILNLQNEISKISMNDEFAKYARLQRKLNSLKTEMESKVSQRLQEKFKVKFFVTSSVQVLLGLITVVFLWMYRHEPVLVVPEAWLSPIAPFISFPTSIEGAVGLPFWFSVCKVFAKSTATVATSIK